MFLELRLLSSSRRLPTMYTFPSDAGSYPLIKERDEFTPGLRLALLNFILSMAYGDN